MRAHIVIDLGFGDSGKGMMVDTLAESITADTGLKPLIVRFSGGQQAGHTVIRDGKKHVFSSFGAGSLQDCPTYFTEDTTFYLPNMFREYDTLQSIGVAPQLGMSPLSMVTTPYDVVSNRFKEASLSKHGSCGMGVGQTMSRNIKTPYKLYAMDLLYPELFKTKLENIKAHYGDLRDTEYQDMLESMEADFNDALERYWDCPVFTMDGISLGGRDVIFEGSQGIMLDMDHGVFPNVTYASTTSKNAIKYIKRFRNEYECSVYYMTRCYTTRHGRGWMPNEENVQLVNNGQEINVFNEWQEDFRIGEFDPKMVKHSMVIDSMYHSDIKVEKNLIVTCMDQRPSFSVSNLLQFAGDVDGIYGKYSAESGNLRKLK